METLDPLRPLYECLEALADVYEQACVAIDTRNSPLTQELIRRSKVLHAAVGEANAALRSAPPTNLRPESVARMRVATTRVQAGNRVVQAWIDAENAAPTSAPEAVRRRLPPDWEFEVDALLIVGAGGAAIARHLLDLGQRRLFVFLPPEAVDDLPPGVITVRTLDDLTRSLANLAGRPPRRSLRWRLSDPLVTLAMYEGASDVFVKEAERLATGKNTLNAMGALWVLQGASNLADIASRPSIDALRQSFRGKPCIIASPGPSLDKNIHLVPAIRDQVLLMTSSHALTALSRAGVVPDVCLALDAQDLRYHFDDCPVERVTVLLGATVHPDLFSLPARQILTFGGNNGLDEWIYRGLGDNALLPTGGSVACTALALAAEWGCDPIMLIGQDLAFSGGQYYSRLSVDGGLKVELSGDGKIFGLADLGKGLANVVEQAGRGLPQEKIIEAPGYFGGTVKTSGNFDRFRAWITWFVKADQRGITFLNCTEGGAYIDGMEHLSLATAIERHVRGPVPIESALEPAIAAVDIQSRKRKMLERMKHMNQGLEECNRLANDCVRIARQAVRNPGRVKALGEAERRLLLALKPVVFLSLLSQEDIVNAVERARQSKSLSQSIDASLELYEVVLSACMLLKPRLARGVARLAAEVAVG